MATGAIAKVDKSSSAAKRAADFYNAKGNNGEYVNRPKVSGNEMLGKTSTGDSFDTTWTDAKPAQSVVPTSNIPDLSQYGHYGDIDYTYGWDADSPAETKPATPPPSNKPDLSQYGYYGDIDYTYGLGSGSPTDTKPPAPGAPSSPTTTSASTGNETTSSPEDHGTMGASPYDDVAEILKQAGFTPGWGTGTVNKWMADSYQDMIDSGKYGDGFGGIYTMLGSGYAPWADWWDYGGGLAKDIFDQTYADNEELKKALGEDWLSKVWSAETGWDDAMMRQVYDILVGDGGTDYGSIFSGEDYDLIKDTIRDQNYFGDDAVDIMRRLGRGWGDYASAAASNPNLTFQQWLQMMSQDSSWDAQAAWDAATDKIMKDIMFGSNLYGPNIDRDSWASIADSSLVYGDGYSGNYEGDDWEEQWRKGGPYQSSEPAPEASSDSVVDRVPVLSELATIWQH